MLGSVWGQGQAAAPRSSSQVSAGSAPVLRSSAVPATAGGGYGGSSTVTKPFAGGGASLNPFAPPSSNPFGGGGGVAGSSSNPFGSSITGAEGSANVRQNLRYSSSRILYGVRRQQQSSRSRNASYGKSALRLLQAGFEQILLLNSEK